MVTTGRVERESKGGYHSGCECCIILCTEDVREWATLTGSRPTGVVCQVPYALDEKESITKRYLQSEGVVEADHPADEVYAVLE